MDESYKDQPIFIKRCISSKIDYPGFEIINQCFGWSFHLSSMALAGHGVQFYQSLETG